MVLLLFSWLLLSHHHSHSYFFGFLLQTYQLCESCQFQIQRTLWGRYPPKAHLILCSPKKDKSPLKAESIRVWPKHTLSWKHNSIWQFITQFSLCSQQPCKISLSHLQMRDLGLRESVWLPQSHRAVTRRSGDLTQVSWLYRAGLSPQDSSSK